MCVISVQEAYLHRLLTEIVIIEEALGYVGAEHHSDAALRHVPAVHVAGVGPEALDHDALVAGLPIAVCLLDVAQFDPILREEAPVADHDLAVDDVAQRQVAEELREEIVGLHVVLGLDFALEAVHFVELLSLVVTPTHEEMLWQTHFPSEQSHDYLYSERASVNEVSIEHIWVLLRGITVDFEYVQQVIVLPMNVATDCNLVQLTKRNVDKTLALLEYLGGLLDDHGCIFPMECFLVFLPLHETHNPLWRYVCHTIQFWPGVA